MGRKHGATRKRSQAKQPSRRRRNRLASLARDRRNRSDVNPDGNTADDYGQRKARQRHE